jgi:CRISPR-associated protein (TIGR03984 family)
MTLTLYGRTSLSITLPDALQACSHPLAGAIALLYSPTACQFAKLQADGHLADSDGSSIDLSTVFEARVFNSDCELRWLNNSNGKGPAVLLSENSIADYLENDSDPLNAISTHPQQYLLWGKGTNCFTIDGWSILATARIGKLPVPIAGVSTNQQAYLQACEYLSTVGDYGNVAVVEERLIGLEVKK